MVKLGVQDGITTPLSNASYSIAKAEVKMLTGQLAREPRKAVGDKSTAHLFVPGYSWTPTNAAVKL